MASLPAPERVSDQEPRERRGRQRLRLLGGALLSWLSASRSGVLAASSDARVVEAPAAITGFPQALDPVAGPRAAPGGRRSAPRRERLERRLARLASLADPRLLTSRERRRSVVAEMAPRDLSRRARPALRPDLRVPGRHPRTTRAGRRGRPAHDAARIPGRGLLGSARDGGDLAGDAARRRPARSPIAAWSTSRAELVWSGGRWRVERFGVDTPGPTPAVTAPSAANAPGEFVALARDLVSLRAVTAPRRLGTIGCLLALLVVAALLPLGQPDRAEAIDLPGPCDVPGVSVVCSAVGDAASAAAGAAGDAILGQLTGWVGDGAAWLLRQVADGDRLDDGRRPLGALVPEPLRLHVPGRGDPAPAAPPPDRPPGARCARTRGSSSASASSTCPRRCSSPGSPWPSPRRRIAVVDALSADLTVEVAKDTDRSRPRSPRRAPSGDPVPLFASFLMALVMALAAIFVWFELILRAGVVYVAMMFLPLFLATMIWPATSGWVRRLVQLIVAAILSKLVIVATLSLGLSALASGDGASAVLAGAGMFLIAAFSPFVLFSLIPLAAEVAQPQRECRHALAAATGTSLAWNVARTRMSFGAVGAGAAPMALGAGAMGAAGPRGGGGPLGPSGRRRRRGRPPPVGRCARRGPWHRARAPGSRSRDRPPRRPRPRRRPPPPPHRASGPPPSRPDPARSLRSPGPALSRRRRWHLTPRATASGRSSRRARSAASAGASWHASRSGSWASWSA